MSTLEGRRAVVTGGTRGIGRAITEAFLEAGAKVAVAARTPEEVDRVGRELAGRFPDSVTGFVADVSDPESCESLMASVVEHFGGLDILVNNAGIGYFAPVDEMEVQDWDRLIGTNLSGVFYCTRAAAPHLIESGDGFVVNIGSLAGRNTFAGGAAYNASKFGLLGLSEAMMLDLRHRGVRVTLVMPGSVSTEFRGPGARDDRDGWALQADDVAHAVVHLVGYPPHALASRIELRPSRPPRR